MSSRWPGSLINKTAPVSSGGGAQDSAPGVWTLDQANPYIATQTWPGTGVPDPQFQYVTALLHGDGTNGGQNNTFLDSSSNNFSITRNGNTTQGSFSPYGNLWSNYFNGVSTSGSKLDLASNAAFGVGTGNFTLEAWFNGSNFFINSGQDYIDNWIVALGLNCWLRVGPTNGLSGSGNAIQFFNGTNDTSLVGPTISVGTWYHVAAVRSGSTLTLYLNGLAVNSKTETTNFGSSSVCTVGGVSGYNRWWNGYISNVRVTKSAVYTANFTPSTTPLTAITNTSLLTCQSNRFIDNSSNAFSITTSGTPSVQRFSPFQSLATYQPAVIGGSGYFDGSGDYLTTPATGQFAPTGNWTISAWFYPNSLSSVQDLIGNYTVDTSTNWTIVINSNGSIDFYLSGGSVITMSAAAGSIKVGQWNYLCITRSSNTATAFVNGTQVATASYSQTLGTASKIIYIGSRLGSYSCTGYIADVKLIDGSAVTTVPTIPQTNTTGTQLLTNFTNGAIFDSDATNVLETVGNAQISTAVVKYGTGSMAFDGTGDYLVSNAASTDLYAFGSGNFTIELWVYFNTVSSDGIIYDCRNAADSTQPVIYRNSAVIQYYANAGNRITSPTIAINTWYHVAVSRAGTTTIMFINGNQVGTYADSTVYTCGAQRPIIGAAGITGFVGTVGLNGYVDDIRVTKGYARYWYNFQPPTRAFPNYGGTVIELEDPLFQYNTLLLNGDGTNGAQNNTFLDSSTNNFTITRNGNTTQGSFSPYGSNWSNFFNGSSALTVSSTSSQFSFSGDFTWEMWINLSVVPTSGGYAGIAFSRGANASVSAFQIYLVDASGLRLEATISIGGTDYNYQSSALTVSAGTWNHYAIVRSGTTVTGYFNGTAVGTLTGVSGTTNTPTVNPSVGARANYGDLYLNGYISNLRMVGSALYTSSFTPSTTPLTAISGTRLLTCQSNRFIDNSSNNFAITTSGSPSVQRFSPFNPTAPYSTSVIGGSGYFDGSGDWLTTPNVTALNLYNTTNTVECWFYPTSFSTDTQIYGSNFDGTDYNRWRLLGTSGYPDYLSRFGTQITGSVGAKLNQWNHIAFGRSGSTMSIWLNGVRVANATISSESAWGTGNIIVGGFDGTGRANGYMSNLRVVKGTDVYGVSNTTITVPTSPVTAIANTAFLLNSTNAGIPDLAMQNNLETIGSAQVNTSVKKYGTGSLRLNTSSDRLLLPSNQGLALGSGNFTIEGWLYPTATQDCMLFQISTASTGYNASTTNTVALYFGTNAWDFYAANTNTSTAASISINTWYHFAVVRYNGTTKLYINGNPISSVSDSVNYTGSYMVFGTVYTNTYGMNGYLDDFRITKGLARYVQPFTPPTAALPTY